MVNETLVAFGSCNKQTRSQEFWRSISSYSPNLFIWTGDAFYSKNQSIEGAVEAAMNISSHPLYREFTDQTEIVGVWDDHDYGVNDGGSHVNDYELRKKNYLSFLGKPDYNGNRGIYGSMLLPMFGPNEVSATVKLIMLDTRSFRDFHFIPSLGEYRFPYAAVLAAGIRTATAVFGMGLSYEGDILGEEQWQWLEKELANSNATFHLIVSSIQVLTSNPAVESWTHFPQSKQRLLNLIQRIDPPGTVFVSGDVHYGELSVATKHHSDGSTSFLHEVTSSGLTHTCATNLLTTTFCPFMLKTFTAHRDKGVYPDVKIERNFGYFQLVARDSLRFRVNSLESNSALFEINVSSDSSPHSPIERISAASFPALSHDTASMVLADLILLCLLCLFAVGYVIHRCCRKQQSKVKRD